MKKLKISKLNLDQEFLQMVNRLEAKEVYASPKDKWLKVFMTVDPENPEDEGYFYCERRGVDSVAFLLLDRDKESKPFICLEQFSSSISKFTKGAYTGSLDKDDKTLEEIVQEEVKEEAGFNVELDSIHPLGKMVVSSHSSEQVNLYLVDVTGLQWEGKAPEGVFEENMRDIRMNKDEIKKHCEWKAQMIVQRSEDFNVYDS